MRCGERASDDLHRPANLARTRSVVVPPDLRRLLRRAARIRGGGRPASARLRARPLRRDRRSLSGGPAGWRPTGAIPRDRGATACLGPAPAQDLPPCAALTGTSWSGKAGWAPDREECHMATCEHLEATPLTPVPTDFEP